MKKILLSSLALIIIVVSCTDREDVMIEYQTDFSITAETIFDSFYEINSGDFNLNDLWSVELNSFIYNEDGNLLHEESLSLSDITGAMTFNFNLEPGEYTLVSTAHFKSITGYEYWTISGESNLASLSITERDAPEGSVFETLGLDVRSLEINNEKESCIVQIKPITALVQIEYQNRQILQIWDRSYQYVNNYSDMLRYIAEARIYQPSFVQVVRFNDKNVVFETLTQEASYQVGSTYYPKDIVDNEGSFIVYNYFALLPQDNSYYYWEADWITTGETERSSTTETVSGLINIESGKQYDMDLLFDIVYLVIGEHDPQMDSNAKLNKYIPIILEQMNGL